MIDTHCHIDFEDFDSDREEVIKRAKDKLDHVIVSGYSNESTTMSPIMNCVKGNRKSLETFLNLPMSIRFPL